MRARLWWGRSFWVLPLLGVLVAWVLSQVLVGVDDGLFAGLSGRIVISTTSAIALLTAVAGGMVTFTGFVFSVVLLVVQYGSSTYSPRAVAYFLRSRTTQTVLAVFLCTITFSLLSLIDVGSSGRANFVPLASILLTTLLLVASLVAFLALLHGVGTRIRVDTVVSDIGHRSRVLLRRAYRVHGGSSMVLGPAGESKDGEEVLRYAGRPGQIVAVNSARLCRLAGPAGGRIVLTVRTGDAVTEGARVAVVTGADVTDRQVSRCLLVDRERSLRFDPLYGLRILTDIALRALSPAVHDPTTAVRSLDEVESVLRTAAAVPLGSIERTGTGGSAVVPRASWQDVVDLALLEVIVVGVHEPQVTRRLVALLDDLITDLPESRRPALVAHRSRLVEQVEHLNPGHAAVWLVGDRQGIGGAS
jgi:uncharacterized membrane protein